MENDSSSFVDWSNLSSGLKDVWGINSLGSWNSTNVVSTSQITEIPTENLIDQKLEDLKKELSSDLIEKILENRNLDPDLNDAMDSLLVYLTSMMEKVLDNPEMLLNIKKLQEENQELRDRIQSIENKLLTK